MACGSANLREVLTLAAYRLGLVAHVVNNGRGGWSTTDRLGLQFRLPVVTTYKSQRGSARSDVWCVTTETGTFTAVNPNGTVYLTGNSCTRPNLQQLPREGGVRACITADPGQLMIGADFSGVEIRVAAALSQDPTLLRFLAEGRDLHGEIALQVWGPDPEATAKAGGVPTAKKAHRYTAIGDPYDKPGYRIRYDNGCEVWVRAYRVRELANPASSPQLLAMPLRADLNVQINHVSGPPVEDGDHIRRWLTGGLLHDARGGWFQFQVCSGHANPADCPEDCGRNFALYRATIIGADWNA
jgi:hypothetical protein